MKIVWKNTIKITIGVVLGVTLFLIGIYMDRYLLNKKTENEMDTSLIAIVNMDNGVTKDGVHTNYASELIELTNPNYVMTGLKEAQEGIINGAYAAYIVLPETLSETVTSLEREPDKVCVEVMYADNLADDAYRQAILDVETFELNLSTNVSYMYIDSLMKELHDAQNDTGQVMANDNMEYNLLTAVDPDGLIAEYVEPEAEYPEPDIKETDYSEYLKKNADIMEGMLEAETKAIEDGNKEFAEIQDQGKEAEDNLSQMDKVIGEASRKVKESEDERLDEGFMLMTEGISGYNRDILEKGYPTIIANLIMSVTSEQIAKDRLCIKEYIENNDGNDPDNMNPTPDSGRAFELDTDEIPFEAIYTQEETEQMVRDALEWEDDVEKLDKLIDDNLTSPLSELIKEENKQIDDAVNTYVASITEYTSAIQNFNPMEYLEDADLGSYISDVETNTYEFYEDIQESNADYAEYTSNLIEATSDRLTAASDALNSANEKTADNVRQSIAHLIDKRSETNVKNIEMLGDFSNMLSYTRLGNRENTEVYDVIADAVSMQDVTPARPTMMDRTHDIIDNISIQDAATILLSICSLVCITIMVYIYKADTRRHGINTG